MLNESISKQNFPAPITSGVRSPLPWRVAEAVALEGFRLAIRFVDGTTGVVDLSELIRSPRAGVFSVLADPVIFSAVFVERGAVTWPGELDLAPDAMYAELKQHGEWKLR